MTRSITCVLCLLSIAAFAQQPPPQDDPIGQQLFPPELIMSQSQKLHLDDKQRAADIKAAQAQFYADVPAFYLDRRTTWVFTAPNVRDFRFANDSTALIDRLWIGNGSGTTGSTSPPPPSTAPATTTSTTRPQTQCCTFVQTAPKPTTTTTVKKPTTTTTFRQDSRSITAR